jgi:hypothetical protein
MISGSDLEFWFFRHLLCVWRGPHPFRRHEQSKRIYFAGRFHGFHHARSVHRSFPLQGALRNLLGRVSKTLQIVSDDVSSLGRALLAWEGHCKPHFIVLCVSHIFRGEDYVVAMATTKSAGFVEEELLYVKPTKIFCLLSCRSA